MKLLSIVRNRRNFINLSTNSFRLLLTTKSSMLQDETYNQENPREAVQERDTDVICNNHKIINSLEGSNEASRMNIFEYDNKNDVTGASETNVNKNVDEEVPDVHENNEQIINEALQKYVSAVRYCQGDGFKPAVMPALDSPYDEFAQCVDVEEPYDTDEEEEIPTIEEP